MYKGLCHCKYTVIQRKEKALFSRASEATAGFEPAMGVLQHLIRLQKTLGRVFANAANFRTDRPM
jgi:hypothetical protein